MKQRAIWIAAASLSLLVLLMLPSPPVEQRAWQASATTHSPGPEGAKAFFSLLQRLKLEAARQLMAQQMDISGNDYLDLRPAIALCTMAQGGNMRILNESQYDPDASNKLQRPNLTRGLVREVVDSPRVYGTSWYLFADPSVAPAIEVAFLDGTQEPYLELQNGFEVDGARYKVRLDYGVAGVDYRGAVRNAGA